MPRAVSLALALVLVACGDPGSDAALYGATGVTEPGDAGQAPGCAATGTLTFAGPNWEADDAGRCTCPLIACQDSPGVIWCREEC